MGHASWPSAEDVTHLAFDATGRAEFRGEVMRRLMSCTDSSMAVFADSLSPIVSSSVVNVSPADATAARSTVLSQSDQLQRPNKELKLHGALVDTLLYSRKEWERLPHVVRHLAAWGVTSNLILSWPDRLGTPVVLNVIRTRGRYDEHDLQRARRLVKALAVADRALEPIPLSPLQMPGLTERQVEILSFVCCGYSNPEIARACGISTFTVRNHLVKLFERYGVSTRTELALAVGSGKQSQ